MRPDHTAASYAKQLFAVWVREELAALELIGFSERPAKRVFCIGWRSFRGAQTGVSTAYGLLGSQIKGGFFRMRALPFK